MSVKIDPTGRRWIQAEVEVPGTPEQVWQAIATGPGISSWFVPTDLEEREGGETVSHFGPGMDSTAKITAWEPPHRFAAEGGDLGSPAPGIGTLGAYDWGGTVHVSVSFYLYGDRAPAAAARDEPLWQEWVKELFPAVASGVAC